MIKNRTRLAVETLEDRALMSVTSVALSSAGVLQINCDDKADNVRLTDNGAGQIKVEDLTYSKPVWFAPTAQVKQVAFEGNGGDDQLNAVAISAPLLANGGTGNDVLKGGAGVNT